MDASLSIKNLSVGYTTKSETKKVLSDVSFDLIPGEVACLIGRNGSGKTTLLRTIAGLQKAISGNVSIGGEDLATISLQKRAQSLSLVLTKASISGSLTVYELLAHGRHPYTNWSGKLKKDDHEIILKVLKMLKLEHFQNRNIHELSDGEKQKIFIARALVQESKTVLLDEPTSFLDIVARAELMKTLRTLAKSLNIAILLTSHDLSLIIPTVDKCHVIENDSSIITGSPQKLLSDGVFSKLFTSEGIYLDKETASIIIE